MRFRITLFLVPLIINIAFLSACSCNGSTGNNSASSVGFSLIPFPRLSDNIVNTHILDDLEQHIFWTHDNHYGSVLISGNCTYYIGESLSPEMEISLVPLQYAGQQVYSWIEVKGATSVVNHYMSFRNNELVYLAGIEGQVVYIDINVDGVNEIIASSVGALPEQVVIHFWDTSEYGTIASLDVVKALNAYSATYHEGCFYVIRKEGASEETYIYSSGKLTYEPR